MQGPAQAHPSVHLAERPIVEENPEQTSDMRGRSKLLFEVVRCRSIASFHPRGSETRAANSTLVSRVLAGPFLANGTGRGLFLGADLGVRMVRKVRVM